MEYQIRSTVKFKIKVPSIEELTFMDIPEPYTIEEWHDQLISDAIHQKLSGVNIEWSEINEKSN